MRFRKTEDREHLSICRAISLPSFRGGLLSYRLFDNARRTLSGTGAVWQTLPLTCITSAMRIINGEGRLLVVPRDHLRRIIGHNNSRTAVGFRRTLECGTF